MGDLVWCGGNAGGGAMDDLPNRDAGHDHDNSKDQRPCHTASAPAASCGGTRLASLERCLVVRSTHGRGRNEEVAGTRLGSFRAGITMVLAPGAGLVFRTRRVRRTA